MRTDDAGAIDLTTIDGLKAALACALGQADRSWRFATDMWNFDSPMPIG